MSAYIYGDGASYQTISYRARETLEAALEIVFEINSGAPLSRSVSICYLFGTNGICMVRARAH